MKHKAECTEDVCYCLDEELGDPMCDCGFPAYACVCQQMEAKAEITPEYWNNQVKTILVPVQITYHPPTDFLVSYELLSSASWHDKIEQAIKTDRERTNKLIEIKSRIAAAIESFEDGNAPTVLQEAAELLASLETDT